MEDNLENLRQAATCAICTEFYTRPKKLPNCPHVFCLHCIQRHMQIHSERNFPPCPMCRKPITFSRSKLVNLDPGIAEQTIVDFVKRYDTCDICGSKSNPNFRCEQCIAFVCDSCLPCHQKLKRSHNLVSIIPSGDNCQVPMKVTRTCMDHDDQPLDLFCIICRRIMCIHCKAYSHAHCNKGSGLEIQRCKRGFLKFFVESSEDRQIRFQSGKLRRTVYIRDFANAGRQWLKKMQPELKSCTKFFQECKNLLENLGQRDSACHQFQQRYQNIIGEIENILRLEDDTSSRAEALLNETSSDSTVAEAILSIEEDCLACFNYRQQYAGYILFAGSNTSYMEPYGSNIKQLCRCISTEVPTKCLCIMPSSYYTQLFTKASGKENVNAELVSNFFRCPFLGRKTSSNNLRHGGNLTGKSYTYSIDGIVNYLYPRFIDKHILMNHGMPFADFGAYMFVDEICSGDMYDYAFKLAGISIEIAKFGIVALPTCYSLQGNSINAEMTRLKYMQDQYVIQDRSVIHLVGYSEYGDGLQSVFIYMNPSDGEALDKSIHCISISANVAKFNKYINPINLFEENYPFDFDCSVIKDEKNAFIVVKNMHDRSNNFLMSYRTIPTSDQVHGLFIIVPNALRNDWVATTIPVALFQTNLLCHLVSGLYFVKQEDTGDMVVGNITFNHKEIKLDIIHTVRQLDTDIPLCKINPLTMVERKDKGIIVVCSFESDNSKFVMIRTDKEGPEGIEILEVDYSRSELRVYSEISADNENAPLDVDSTDVTVTTQIHTKTTTENDVNNQTTTFAESNVMSTMLRQTDSQISEPALERIDDATLVDLEMDIDGNIMFLLKGKDGHSYCVCTKYLLP